MNLLLQWEESLEQGHELLPQSLCAMSPHLETELRQRIEILRGTKWLSEDAPAWDDFTPGGVLANRYHLEALIAQGGFSIVWRGFDVNLKRTVVLKLPKTPHPDAGDRIQREAYRMARLRHPSILTVYDLLRTPSSSCLVLEFLAGGTLRERAGENRPSDDWTEAIQLAPANATYRQYRSQALTRLAEMTEAAADVSDPDALNNREPDEIVNSIGMRLKLIPAGAFQMGADTNTKDFESQFGDFQNFIRWKASLKNEGPVHEVTITQPFYLGATDVTVGQFARFFSETGYQSEAERLNQGAIGFNAEAGKVVHSTDHTWRTPGFDQTEDHCVLFVSYLDASEFCHWLSRIENRKYELPTEAEWEYACCGSTRSHFSFGDTFESLWKNANVRDRSMLESPELPTRPGENLIGNDGHVHTAPVAQFPPHSFGLFDMHGNAWEWCRDVYDPSFYQRSPRSDPVCEIAKGGFRVVRAGSWNAVAITCRSSYRSRNGENYQNASIGFRVRAEVKK